MATPGKSKQHDKSNQSKSATKKAKRAKKSIINGNAYIQASFNNTLVYITDLDGNVLGWATAGSEGFKGSRKSTPYAAQIAAKKASQTVSEIYGMRSLEVFIKGPGPGREAAARMLGDFFKVISVSDVTGIPHNGCRAEKERRN